MRPWSPPDAQRLKGLVRDSGKTQEQVASESGVALPTFKRILGGKSVPDDEKLAAILRSIGATEADLVSSDERPIVEVPIYDIDVAAGPGRFLDAEAVIGTWPFPRAWIEQRFGRDADLALVRVSGDSQEPELRDGDSVMLDLNVRRREGMSVVRLDDALLIKRLQLEGRTVRLGSNNAAYQDIVVDLADEGRFDVIGKAVWAGKLL